MKKVLLASIFAGLAISAMAAYQYEHKGNQGWLTFDSETTVAFDLARSGKDKDHENFIDRGEGIADYGWYNLDTGETGSFSNGLSATFNENDRIGLYVTDEKGDTFLSTKPRSPFEDDIWGKAEIVDGNLQLGGGNMGSNGTHEFYIFKVNTANASGKTPSGQPLPGIIAVLAAGGIAFGASKLYRSKKIGLRNEKVFYALCRRIECGGSSRFGGTSIQFADRYRRGVVFGRFQADGLCGCKEK